MGAPRTLISLDRTARQDRVPCGSSWDQNRPRTTNAEAAQNRQPPRSCNGCGGQDLNLRHRVMSPGKGSALSLGCYRYWDLTWVAWAAHRADASQVPGLLAQLGIPPASFTADVAYDGGPICEAVLAAGHCPRIVVSPPRRAVVAGPSEPLIVQRDAAISAIQREGWRAWKKVAGYHQQARAVPSAATSAPLGRACGLGMAKARITR